MNYIDDTTPVSLKGVKKENKSAINKSFFDIDKSLIERIPLVSNKNKPTISRYIDVVIDTNIDKEQIKVKKSI